MPRKKKSRSPKLSAASSNGDSKQFDPVNHPRHYNWHPRIECIDVVEWMGFNLGNVIKYLWRADEKGFLIEDLQKAAWYLQREIQRRGGK